MTALMWQFALLLACAYFLGAFLACIVRRTFFARTLTQSGAIARPVAVASPVQQPAQQTAQQTIPAAVATSVAAKAAASDPTTRFERALTGQGAGQAPAPVAPAAPVAVAPPAAAAPVAAASAPAPVAAPAVTAPPAASVAVAAAATAAAAAAAAAVVKPLAPTPPHAAGNLPAASGSSGPAAVTAPLAAAPAKPVIATRVLVPVVPTPVAVAPVAVAPVAPVPVASAQAAPSAKQDLSFIRSIDGGMQTALNGLGVNSYADIANWKTADVARIASALKIPGRIEQENWIEQAQILSKGGETYFSRRKKKGELQTSQPSPNVGDKIAVPAPAAVPPAVAATAIAPATVAPPVVVPPPAAPVVQAVPAVIDLKAAAATAAAAVQSVQAAATAPAVAVAAAAAASVVAPAPVAEPVPADRPVGMTRDALQRIGGVNAEVEKLLNVQGVTRYAQIAGWQTPDVSRFDRLLGFEGRIARENWIEQAQILTKGGETAYSREMSRRLGEPTVQPAQLAEAIQAKSSKEELSALRSVRSEAYRSPEQASLATVSIGAAGQQRSADDLKRIRGVGVLIEKKLNQLGVTRYDQVANWTVADIERFSDKLDFKGRIERENWVEQARILSAGGQTEFSQRVDRGEVETSKPAT